MPLAGGVRSPLPPGRTMVRGEGGSVWDDRGEVYTDLIMGYGAVSIGHGEKTVVEAVTARAASGTLLPGLTAEEEALRRALHELFPHTEFATLHKTGSEGVAAALRLARTATGRPLVVRCGFHGWHDELIQSHRRWHDDRAMPGPAPSPTPGVRTAPAALDWSDGLPATLARILETHPVEVAAVLLDPIQLAQNPGARLAETAALCRRAGALFILDELKTCPRVALGGVQEACGVQADLTIVGKGLANGFPFAAVLGPAWLKRTWQQTRIMGTFNGDLAGFAAVLATLEVCRTESAPQKLARLGLHLVEETRRLLAQRGVLDRMEVLETPWPCMPRMRLPQWSPHEEALPMAVAKNHACILIPHVNFVCLRHTAEELGHASVAIADAVAMLGGAE